MGTEIDIARVFLSLLLVAGLIGLFAVALKWFSEKSLILKQMGGNKRLKLVEASNIDHKHRLFLVACDDKEYVLVSNGNHVTMLDSKDKEARHPREGGDPCQEAGKVVNNNAKS